MTFVALCLVLALGQLSGNSSQPNPLVASPHATSHGYTHSEELALILYGMLMPTLLTHPVNESPPPRLADLQDAPPGKLLKLSYDGYISGDLSPEIQRVWISSWAAEDYNVTAFVWSEPNWGSTGPGPFYLLRSVATVTPEYCEWQHTGSPHLSGRWPSAAISFRKVVAEAVGPDAICALRSWSESLSLIAETWVENTTYQEYSFSNSEAGGIKPSAGENILPSSLYFSALLAPSETKISSSFFANENLFVPQAAVLCRSASGYPLVRLEVKSAGQDSGLHILEAKSAADALVRTSAWEENARAATNSRWLLTLAPQDAERAGVVSLLREGDQAYSRASGTLEKLQLLYRLVLLSLVAGDSKQLKHWTGEYLDQIGGSGDTVWQAWCATTLFALTRAWGFEASGEQDARHFLREWSAASSRTEFDELLHRLEFTNFQWDALHLVLDRLQAGNVSHEDALQLVSRAVALVNRITAFTSQEYDTMAYLGHIPSAPEFMKNKIAARVEKELWPLCLRHLSSLGKSASEIEAYRLFINETIEALSAAAY